jgi:putative IMPACT (imprinted ancient) family translation regulator
MAKAEVVERFVEEFIAVSFAHPRTSVVMRIAARNGARIVATEYDEGVRMTLAIRAGRRHELVESLVDETGGQAVVSGPLPPSELPPSRPLRRRLSPD